MRSWTISARFIPPVMRIGAFSSLSQQLLKLTAPGVPDIYQGTELWDFSLVDPDNRRPVDYERRTALLDEMLANPPSLERAAELLADLPTGRIKLYLTTRALAHRAAHPDLYARGDYEPLETRGPLAANLVAFRRTLDDDESIVVVPRLVGQVMSGSAEAPIGEAWRDTVVLLGPSQRGQRYRNELTGEVVEAIGSDDEPVLDVESILRGFPVALLRRESTRKRNRTGKQ